MHKQKEEFQSAPLTKARGDSFPPPCEWGYLGFNPLPSPKQGETKTLWLKLRDHGWFQSAPLTKARGDLKFSVTLYIRSSFQSAPLTKARGDLQAVAVVNQNWYVSIRSPHQSKGRPRSWTPRCAERRCFNPLPSPKQGETSLCLMRLSTSRLFQSAPLTKARGDAIRTAATQNEI